MSNLISIILLLKNGAKYLPESLSILSKQKGVGKIELVVIDSGSTDDGLKILEGQKRRLEEDWGDGRGGGLLRLIKIKPGEFGHAKTRNLGVREANGELVVFLTQDAIPLSDEWLSILIKPLKNDPQTAGVFGRQIPWPKTNPIEKFFYTKSYPNNRRIMTQKDSENFSNQNIFFSNVNGAARKELLLKYPFNEEIIMSEDQFWGREVLKSGYTLIYEPRAEVWHAHNYSLKNLFKRYFQSGYSQRQMGLKGEVWKKGAGTFFELIGHIVKTNIFLLPYTFIYVLIKGGAFFLGRRKILPGFIENKLLK